MNAHQVLSREGENIIAQWIKTVKEELPEAREHSDVALRDNLPKFMNALSERLLDTEEVEEMSFEHGALRVVFENYSLVHVIREYHILRKLIFAILEAEIEVTFKERNLIHSAIDLAVEQSSEVFFRLRSKIEADARALAEAGLAQLKEDDELRNKFIQGLSHDLKNPMHNISLILELYKEQVQQANESKDSGHELMFMLDRNVQRSVTLLNNLMDITMITAGIPLPIHIKETDLVQVLQEHLRANPLMSENTLKTDFPQTPLTGYWDPDAILRAVDNLLQNAERYGDPERGITIGCKSEDDQVKIVVHNFGDVVSESERKNIFSRMYKLNLQNNVGYGLGLSIVSEIAHLHGGTVSLESDPNDGTSFFLLLPRDSRKATE